MRGLTRATRQRDRAGRREVITNLQSKATQIAGRNDGRPLLDPFAGGKPHPGHPPELDDQLASKPARQRNDPSTKEHNTSGLGGSGVSILLRHSVSIVVELDPLTIT